MILESLKNADTIARLGQGFAKAIEFLRRSDLAALADGKYPIEGEKIFASVQSYTTKPYDKCAWESHRRYADVQMMIAGREGFGYAPLETMKVTAEYDPAKDVQFLEGQGIVLPVEAGSLIVFLPHDVHRPCIAIHDVPLAIRKVVVKVAVLS